LLFYFSGHGTTLSEKHYLVLSDRLICTQDIISFLDAISARNKGILHCNNIVFTKEEVIRSINKVFAYAND
ncbi:caspase family protein, partial [Faecalibacterium prausnitzii]